jgi:hypothetical protein
VRDRTEIYDLEEPLDLLFDELLEDIKEKKELIDPNLSSIENIANLENELMPRTSQAVEDLSTDYSKRKSRARGSIKSRGEDARRKSTVFPDPVSVTRPGPEGEISDYIRSLVDGRTKFVTRKRERRILDEKIFVLHHESGQDILLPSPAEMRELQALSGGKGLEKIHVGTTVKKTVILKPGFTAEQVLAKSGIK